MGARAAAVGAGGHPQLHPVASAGVGFGRAGADRYPAPRVLIRVADYELDLARFEHLLASARSAARSGSWQQAGLQHLCGAHPLREHLHALLMLALYRYGRHAE